MSNTTISAILWIAAFVILVLYLIRRRKRRTLR
ncbi:MAG TPA: LPXTG cell wall anchor domain-containing protein [Bryobacteraceae bacterium]|jgi:LPXTG-motif cell wall-anchored protein|nr:LPXTG cell wall anchor domain-containing protein [Bryobacteraceae bacterium]